MNLPRLWRTLRYLSAEQWYFSILRRLRRLAMQAVPTWSHRLLQRTVRKLPLPDPIDPRLVSAATHVMALQEALYGGQLDDIRKCRFVLLNRRFDFGAPDAVAWRGEFHEGNNPLRRMVLAYMGYAVPLLASGRREDLDLVVALLRSMERANPWTVPGVLNDVWNTYTVSHRLINLLCGLALYRRHSAASDAEAMILEHVRFCAAMILNDRERDLQFNHLMKNYVALAVYAAGLDEMPRVMRRLHDGVLRSLRQNVLSDGGHAERSPMYHALALIDARTLQATGLYQETWQQFVDGAVNRLAPALATLTHPDGDIALFNDSWIGEAPRSSELAPTNALPETAHLAETGYVRIGRDDEAVIFDCGPCGPDRNPAHAHGDFLSIELSVGGRRLIVDPGVATYTEGDVRNESRSAASHNGPHVTGLESIEIWKSFRVGRRGTANELRPGSLERFAPLWCAGRHSGYRHAGISVRRFVGLWPGQGCLICDMWTGRPGPPESSSFLIPAPWQPESEKPPVVVAGAVRVAMSSPVGRIEGVEPARRWARFAVAEDAIRITAQPDYSVRDRRMALWFDWGQSAPPDAATLARLFDALSAA